MDVLIITSRDYYKLIGSSDWEPTECAFVKTRIESIYSNAGKGDVADPVVDFYIQENSKDCPNCEDFWIDHSNSLDIFYRIGDNCLIYVFPCIPRVHNEIGNICEELKTRQNLIGEYLKSVFEHTRNNNYDVGDVYLLCHEADVFSENAERLMNIDDLIKDSILGELIQQKSISIDRIYGYSHMTEINDRVYKIFDGKLRDKILPDELFKMVREFFEKAKANVNATISANINHTIITFSFNNGKLTCKLQNSNNEVLYNQICKCISNFDVICRYNREYKAYIILHKESDLSEWHKKNKQYTFAQEVFEGAKNKELIPVIHFCNCSLEDVVNYYRYAAIMDSSIWNYFVKADMTDNAIIFDVNNLCRLKTIIERIIQNVDRSIYKLSIAKEYAELHFRLTKEAYLYDFEGAHAKYVTPFVFHSESLVEKQLIEKELINDKERRSLQKIRNQKWRILLVDDKASRPMSPFSSSEESRLDCKIRIIKYWLNEVFRKEAAINHVLDEFVVKDRPFDINQRSVSDSDNTNILLEYVENLDDAKTALKTEKFDIILLDYLLLSPDGKGETKYGYELLEELSNESERKSYKVGPRGKFFFMFISAYSSTVPERLLAEGLNLNEDYWYVSLGACPTNTPQLFLYNLIKLMEKRLDDSGILELSTKRICKLVESIYHPKEGGVRKNANNKYHEVLSLQYHYRKMLSDVNIPESDSIYNTKGSVLVTNFIQKNVNLGGMLEHLNHLVHLTAFGTIRQWPEMWEEYIYFKGQFKAQNVLVDAEPVTLKEINDMTNHIEDYIKTLKIQ